MTQMKILDEGIRFKDNFECEYRLQIKKYYKEIIILYCIYLYIYTFI